MDYSPPGSSVHGDSSGKNTGVGCHAILQRILPTQGLNPGLLHYRWFLYHLNHFAQLDIIKWVTNGTSVFAHWGSPFCTSATTIKETWYLAGRSHGGDRRHPSQQPQLITHTCFTTRQSVSRTSLSWLRASLVAQLVKNPPAMRETWVQSLGWEDPLEKGRATHFSILAWRIPWTV